MIWRLIALLLAFFAFPGWAGDEAFAGYWLWRPGVGIDRLLKQAGRLYLFQGELLARKGKVRYERRGFSPPLSSTPPLVLVYRCETLDWPEGLYRRIERDLEGFAARGSQVWGIQVDFDAATRHLDRYGVFLRKLRAELPAAYRISVTGLLDWASQGRLQDLDALLGVVDEVVFQTYQGSHPVPDHARYLYRLAQRDLALPFRIGLIKGGNYDQKALAAVQSHPSYRGTVYFLLQEP